MDGKASIALILGGCRSGKSRWAKEQAESAGPSGVYIATAEARDAEMKERIRKHQQDRGPFWETREIPFELPSFLKAPDTQDKILLVDCLTIWLSNVLLRDGEAGAHSAIDELIETLPQCPAPLFLVANEVGMGIVPDTSLGRQYRDLHGFLNQRVAAIADTVVFMAAGLPLWLKKPAT